jgi:hypothetical protein
LIKDENSDSYEGFMGMKTAMKKKQRSFTGFIWFLKAKEKVWEKSPVVFK